VACVVAQADDDLEFTRSVIPGGTYARVRLRGEPAEMSAKIGPTFERVAESVEVDPDRPWLEYYRRHDEVQLFVPVSGE
jgi:DNA gyrase inhibitor GyrI